MQTRYVRLVCRSRHDDFLMYLDAAVETTEQGSAIVDKAMMCGFMRSDSGDLNPFVVRKEKRDPDATHQLSHVVDFGTDYDEDTSRYFYTNLPSKPIQKATQFTVRWYDDTQYRHVDHTYEIREIVDLLRQQSLESL